MKILIVGAGVGGTAVAARLAKQGHEVKVYEKNGFQGGRCSLIHHEGHRFDQGPSLLLMLELFEQTFADLGLNLHEELELLKCTPNYKVHFHDGKVIELGSDLPALLHEIRKYEPEEPEQKTLAFLKETEQHYRYSVAHALGNNFNSIWDVIRPHLVEVPFRLHIWDTVYNRVSKYFQSEYLRRAFTFQTMYLGMSPYDAPAPYNLLQYTEMAGGIWYPKGGFTEVVRVLEQFAKKHGATFNYNSEVTKVNVNQSKEVTGVTVGGVTEDADLVICNADLVYAYNNLLPETKYGKSLGVNAKLTCSSISFYWSMRSVVKSLSTHNIFLAKDYKPSFDDIFQGHTLPAEPSFYVNVPSRIDPTAAPPGKDTIVVLVPTGHLLNQSEASTDSDIDTLVSRARSHVLKRLERELGISNFQDLIEHETVNDPRDWQKKFNLWQGSILGLSHNVSQVLAFRPKTRSAEFKNLYFVGASTQPGTGVPLVLCSAKFVAEQIQTDLVKRTTKTVPKFDQIPLKLSLVLIILIILLLSFVV